jgi:hypothetical protein
VNYWSRRAKHGFGATSVEELMNPSFKSFAVPAKALVYLRYPTVASKRHLVP